MGTNFRRLVHNEGVKYPDKKEKTADEELRGAPWTLSFTTHCTPNMKGGKFS